MISNGLPNENWLKLLIGFHFISGIHPILVITLQINECTIMTNLVGEMQFNNNNFISYKVVRISSQNLESTNNTCQNH
jgi:hypothetical protein